MNENTCDTERIKEAYRELAGVSVGLNAVSDELGKSVGLLEAALNKLNLGVTSWVTIEQRGIYEWRFSEAPRRYRVVAVPFFGYLLKALARDAKQMLDDVTAKVVAVEALHKAVREVATG